MDLRDVLGRLTVACCFLLRVAHADTAAFDLTGPVIDVKVQRAGKTLPISQVPNLRVGDRIWIHPALPPNQSVRYLLIATFLRGATNPPPEDWFTRAETWNKKIREEGIFVTVPEGAEQAVIFLAPDTTGGFTTLRSAVRGKPGSFVRAIQDLEQASLDRSRLDAYLLAMRSLSESDPAALHDRSLLLARSLNVRLDEDCYKKLIEQQAACLTQKSDSLVLNDGHSQSMVGALTQGPASDLIGQITYTPTAGSGYFSPYVGAIVDMGRILDSLHTAQYQYIPALGLPKQDQLQTKLNSPPSFHNPKSVILISLPPVKTEEPPPLRAVDVQQASCLQTSPLVLQTAGAPLAYSTNLLHDLVLRIPARSGKAIDLPAKPDPLRGGYLIDTQPLSAAPYDQVAAEGTLHGFWGFDPYTGPSFKLQSSHPVSWTLPPAENATLLAGRDHNFSLFADSAACVSQVTIKTPQGTESKVPWSISTPGELTVKVPAAAARAGTMTLAVKQAGLNQADEVKVNLYAEAGTLDRFVIIPGDQQAVLHGSHLDEVASVEVSGIRFTPSAARVSGKGEYSFSAPSPTSTAALTPEVKGSAHVALKDGRRLEVPAVVETPRPGVTLLSKRVELGAMSTASAIRLTNPDELPLDGRLFFSLKSDVPKVFPRGQKIEISSTDDSLRVMLSIADGSLTLQDPRTVLATLEPSKSFGNSGFGALRFRPVDERGLEGDWQPLAMLVRVPSLTDLRCPEDVTQQCTLSGTNLFLLDSVAADAQFTASVPVPEGFVEPTLRVPRPTGPLLYIKLRDDPKDINTASLPVSSDKPPL